MVEHRTNITAIISTLYLQSNLKSKQNFLVSLHVHLARTQRSWRLYKCLKSDFFGGLVAGKAENWAMGQRPEY